MGGITYTSGVIKHNDPFVKLRVRVCNLTVSEHVPRNEIKTAADASSNQSNIHISRNWSLDTLECTECI